ncbi:MAG: TIGR00341 family protein, partial [Desulfobulbales bacterium]
DFSIGLLLLPEQKNFARSLTHPEDIDSLIELALRKDAQAIDIIQCNDQLLFFKASIGRIPIIDYPARTNRLRIFWEGLRKLWSLKLLPFSISAVGKQKKDIQTAACGCMIVQHHKRSLASRLIAHDSSNVDGMISLVLVAPFSVIDYARFVFQTLTRSEDDKSIPNSTGYIKSPEIIIETEEPMQVDIDGEPATTTPLHCKVLPGAIRVNLMKEMSAVEGKAKQVKELILVDALPAGKELQKARNRKVPIFTYASEERFRDLFTALRDDARIGVIYIVLMLLSTILATTGLYLNSASVIIGAMLLAPLMAPIVSLAMGLLRQDESLMKHSIGTIALGILLALLTAALMALFFTYKPVTAEMEARLSPTVLDLIVAITAGVAGAYTKSHKEILQSLAGVAIAVALVPPLAVAGIGIGRLDPEFFGQAFLLFSTNLVGIVVAATFTFRLLGYSAAVKSKRGIGIVFFLLILISIPLYLSYNHIVETRMHEKSWQKERFLVHGKYLIIRQARLSEYGNRDILTVDILARDQLTRNDLAELKRKINYNFTEDLVIRANIIYIP